MKKVLIECFQEVFEIINNVVLWWHPNDVVLLNDYSNQQRNKIQNYNKSPVWKSFDVLLNNNQKRV